MCTNVCPPYGIPFGVQVVGHQFGADVGMVPDLNPSGNNAVVADDDVVAYLAFAR